MKILLQQLNNQPSKSEMYITQIYLFMLENTKNQKTELRYMKQYRYQNNPSKYNKNGKALKLIKKSGQVELHEWFITIFIPQTQKLTQKNFSFHIISKSFKHTAVGGSFSYQN